MANISGRLPVRALKVDGTDTAIDGGWLDVVAPTERRLGEWSVKVALAPPGPSIDTEQDEYLLEVTTDGGTFTGRALMPGVRIFSSHGVSGADLEFQGTGPIERKA